MLRPLIGLLAATLSVASLFALASPPGPQWQGVEDALNQGLPRTAIERLDPLIERARREGATAEAIRAIGLKIQLQSQIQGNKPAVRIRLLEEALPEASDEMRPAMQAILAHWYWDYYLQHRGRIGQRTAAAEPQPAELETWDLKRIFAEIDRRFQEALAPAAKLQAIPIAEYDALLEKGSAPDRYRPTLYDFLVHDAIAFYAAGEQAGARPEEAFVLAAESPVFAELDDFLSWQPETSDRPNPLRRAVQLYQDVLRFHADDSDPAARLDANLDRLRFAFAQSEGETKTDRYLAALKRLESKASAHPLSTRALYHWASQCRQAGRLVKAHELAERAVARFPDSPGAKACRELITQIESPALQIDTERVWSSDSEAAPRLQARYKNLTQVDLRLVAFDFDAFLRSGKPNFQQLFGDESQREALLRRPAVRQWSATLPATADYQERLETISPPEDLPTGGFLLLATSAGGFDESDPVS